MSNKLAKREEVPVQLTWDVSLIYKTKEDLWADIALIGELTKEVNDKYKGNLSDAKNIVECLLQYESIIEKINKAVNYSDLSLQVDLANGEANENYAKVSGVVAQAMSDLSFIDSEICVNSKEVLSEAAKIGGRVSGYINEVIRMIPHKLHPEVERVLAANAEVFRTPYTLYNQAKLADMKFDSFEVDGKEYPLGYSLFEDDYEYDKDAKVRRKAFECFSKKIKEYENVTGAAYNAQVREEKIESNLRGYNSVFEFLLDPQHVTRQMYNRQIDLIMEKLAPHMRKYAAVLAKIHKLDKMTYADLKIGVDPEYDPKVTIEEAEKYIADGLSVMGEEYVAMVHQAFKERWVDFAKNQGKCTGGFCASPYGVPASFILLSWNDRMADVITLAHELGHAGHFKACNNAQGLFDTEVSRYLVEAPSTMNEIIMANYLLKTNPDKRFRRWVLSCMVGNTYYHNFVTHLLEAAYQREVYEIIDKGGSVHAASLNAIMKDVLTKFWGDAVELTEGAELTWMRQPHYYMGLYSYTYSAGLTIATQVCRRIEEEGEKAVSDWKEVLKAGSTLDPMEFAARAGVDISTDEPLLNTIEYIGSMIDEICELTEELGF